MAKGDLVLIRSAQGQPGLRRIWKDDVERPFVCHEDYWKRWEALQVEPVCWQVGKEQLYRADEALAAELETVFAAGRNGDAQATMRLNALWTKARRYP